MARCPHGWASDPEHYCVDNCEALRARCVELEMRLAGETALTARAERVVEAARAIANDGCGYGLDRRCAETYPADRDEWCWCCIARAALAEYDEKGEAEPPSTTAEERAERLCRDPYISDRSRSDIAAAIREAEAARDAEHEALWDAAVFAVTAKRNSLDVDAAIDDLAEALGLPAPGGEEGED